MTATKTRAARKSKAADSDTMDLFAAAGVDAGAVTAGSSGGGGLALPPGGAGSSEGDFIDMGTFAERSYLTYAMSVVRGRAIPNIEDGQKPVQRRILHVMNEMGLKSNVPHTKSARIVGDVLGKFHPHGDASTYEALVRMAQDFSLRYPLIDGQGNFGTQDGDSAAAYRYTEARLTPIAELLLAEIDQDTVDFMPNYDGKLKEPELLPARLPMLLLNGASGVGVGMACELQPHNLREVAEAAVAMINRPNISLEALLGIIKGPDFPGGAQIISPPQAIVDAYTSGRGSLRARCRWKIENLTRGQWQVVVYELPPTTSSMRVATEIEELTNPKPREKGGKVSSTQSNLRQLILASLDKVNDESDKSNRVRLVLEPRSSKQNPDEFMQLVMAHTSLEENFPINMVTIGLDGKPQRKNIRQMLEEWVSFRLSTVTRRIKFRLGQVDRRIHILEGRHIAYLNIDKVIKVIRNSDEPKPELMAAFKLTEIQAEDILEIRLRQLARLEGIKIEQDLKALKIERKELKGVLDDERELKKLVIKEIREDAKKFGDERRTLIEESGRASVERQVIDEPLTVIVSRNGWVRSRQGHGLDLAAVTYKDGDGEYAIFETRSIHQIAIIDSTGRCFGIAAGDIPGGKGDGVPLTSLVELAPGARIAHVVDAQPGQRYLVANSGGYGFVVNAENLLTRVRAGKVFMTLQEGETVLRPAAAPKGAENAVTLSEKGRMLLFSVDELKEMARGRGVMLMGLDDNEKMTAVGYSGAKSVTVTGLARNGNERSAIVSGADLQKHILHRARKGCLIPGKMVPTGIKAE
jgi:topoisomerase IV subunit A